MKKTIIVNKKTEEQFVSAEDHINVNLSGESKVMFTLTREDGTTKEVSESTFKRWYKTVEVEIQEVEIKNSKKTGHQKIAAANITNAYNWIIGGHENDFQDGNVESMPSAESMFEEVYEEAMNSKYEEGMCSSNKAPKEMRFAGAKFCKKFLYDLFIKDGYKLDKSVLTHKAHSSRSSINLAVKAADVTTGAFIRFYPKPKMDFQQISVEAANELFNGIDLDYENGRLSAGAFNRPRRAYVDVKTGFVGIRFNNQFFEIIGLNAYNK